MMDENGRQTYERTAGVPQLRLSRRTRSVEIADYGDPYWFADRERLALTARALGVEPPEEAREFEGTRLCDLAASHLRVCGRHLGVKLDNSPQTFELALSVTDFPRALSLIVEKVLQETYLVLDQAYTAVSSPIELGSFRTSTMVRAAEIPGLLQVGESGEVLVGSIPDSGEPIKLARFARRASIPLEILVNDDTGFLRDLGVGLAQRQLEFENQLVIDTLAANPTLGDGTAMFTTGRGNLAGSGAAFSASTFNTARKALMQFTGPAGKALNLKPAAILCGPDAVTTVEAELTKLALAQAPPIRVVADASLGTSWYVIARSLPPMRHATLSGRGGAMMVTNQKGWASDGLEVRVSHAFAAAPIDWRCFKNAGA